MARLNDWKLLRRTTRLRWKQLSNKDRKQFFLETSRQRLPHAEPFSRPQVM